MIYWVSSKRMKRKKTGVQKAVRVSDADNRVGEIVFTELEKAGGD